MSEWSVIVGRAGSEKGELARRVIDALLAAGLQVGGFVQKSVADAAGETLGWDVERIDRSERCVLARTSPEPTLCSYAFEAEGFARAADWSRQPADVVVVGGVGKIEAARGGHWPLLEGLILDPDAPHVIACVRDSCLATVALALPDPVAHVTSPCDAAELSSFAQEVAVACASRKVRAEK